MKKSPHSYRIEGTIQTLRQSFDQLRRGTLVDPERMMHRIAEQVSRSMEELQAAEEELRLQYEQLQAAQAAVEAEHSRYSELFEHIPDGSLVTTRSGNIKEVNCAAAELLEAEQSELLGKSIMFYVEPSERRNFLLRLGGIDHSVLPLDWETRLRGCKGNTFPAAVRITTRQDREKAASDFRWLIRDLSEKKQAEAQLRYLSYQLLHIQEEERRRISMDLHDSIGQYLSAAKFSVENVLIRLGSRLTDSEKESLGAIIPILQDSISEVRRIYTDLRPPVLDEMGILMTINWFCRQYQTIYPGIRVEWHSELDEAQIPQMLKIVIFRIVQEAFHNIARHSRAEHVVLRLVHQENRIALLISDNGTGFDPGTRKGDDIYRKGLGLISMKERAQLSGGSFEIVSSPGHGTRIKVIWPVCEQPQKLAPFA